MRMSKNGWPLHVDEVIHYAVSDHVVDAMPVRDSVVIEQGISVPAGFRTDLASVPRAFWRVFPPFGRYSLAAIVHDYLYSTVSHYSISRACADRIFLDAMHTLGVSKPTRWSLYSAVRVGGWMPWGRQRGDR